MPASRSGRPRIFVSSTIHDFRDLRSALKFWLEELGYEVMLSELNDFAKPFDANSYNACLQAIDDCEYFVLLIGARTGGVLNEQEGLSITRMEYRHAYERLKQGRLKLLVFVRKEIWDVREDRRNLERFLHDEYRKDHELSDQDVVALTNHPSHAINNPAATFSFLADVARSSEMKQAVTVGADFPKGNWIHVFNTFEDIALALRQALHITGNLRRRALVLGLRQESIRNLSKLLIKRENEIVPVNQGAWTAWAILQAQSRSQEKGKLTEDSPVEARLLNTLIIGTVALRTELETRFLDEALRSGEFLEHDGQADNYKIGPLLQCLIELGETLEAFRKNQLVAERRTQLFKYVTKGSGDETVFVSNVDLAVLGWLHEQAETTIRALVSAFRILGGQPGVETAAGIKTGGVIDIPTKNPPTWDEIEHWANTVPL